MYKLSKYNIEVGVVENQFLLFNSVTRAFATVDPLARDIMADLGTYSASKNPAVVERVATMKKGGFIVPESRDETGLLVLQREAARFHSEVLTLILAPTMNCNMACPYCFEKKVSGNMSEEIMNKIISFAEDYMNENVVKEVSVTWYGGEPLLQKDTIYLLSDKLIALCAQKNVAYNADIITNGVLLDIETAKRLVERKVFSAQITIDGTRDYHNKRRILKSKEDSFTPIVNNIQAVKDIINIRVRVNVDKDNIQDVESLIAYFTNELGWGNNPMFYLAPVRGSMEFCLYDENICLQDDQFSGLELELTQFFLEKTPESARHTLYPSRLALFCQAEGRGSYVIDPDGYLYTCWQNVGAKEFAIGHLDGPAFENETYIKWLSNPLPHACLECSFLPCCQGGCGYERIHNDTAQCTFQTFSYIEKLKLAFIYHMNQTKATETAD
jgi:radical SAM additional 4Fe4S-binding domain